MAFDLSPSPLIPGVDSVSRASNYNDWCAGDQASEQYDLLGIGFGPANLAIAVALVEHWNQHEAAGTQPIIRRACFIESHPCFSRHPGIILPQSRTQINFLKDLATLKHPSSEFTFLKYLHAHGRLSAFVNQEEDTPTPREYADYMAWVAARILEVRGKALCVCYGEDVLSVESLDNGRTLTVRSRAQATGEVQYRTTRNLIYAPGGIPKIPQYIVPYAMHPRVTHTSTYIHRVSEILEAAATSAGSRALRIAILGAGQSSAEILLDLRSRLAKIIIDDQTSKPGHLLDLITHDASLKPSADSPFVSGIFDSKSTDNTGYLSAVARTWLRSEYAGTNCGVVNPQTLETLHKAVSSQNDEHSAGDHPLGVDSSKNKDRVRTNIVPYQEVLAFSVDDSQGHNNPTFSIHTRHSLTNQEQLHQYDAVIMGTGYERQSWSRMFKPSGLKEAVPLNEVFGLVTQAPAQPQPAIAVTTSATAAPLPELDRVETPTKKVQATGPPPSPRSGTNTPTSSTESATDDGLHPGVRITRAYRLFPTENHGYFTARVYLQGCGESSYGLSDTLLSMLAQRSGEVFDDIVSAEKHCKGSRNQ